MPSIIDPNYIGYDVNHSEPVDSCYIICSIPRTGSTMLSWGLWETGIAGFPHEYLHREKHMQILSKRWNVTTLQDYLHMLKKKRTSKNGVFGMKAHFHQFNHFFNNLPIDQYFNNLRYIYITRQNHLKQAVSFAKALQTKKWAYDEQALREPVYNFDEIKDCLKQIIYEEKMWEEYFQRKDIIPFRIRYENLVDNYSNSIKDVLNYIGVSNVNYGIAPPATKPMADKVNAQWCVRFKKEYEEIEKKGALLNTDGQERKTSGSLNVTDSELINRYHEAQKNTSSKTEGSNMNTGQNLIFLISQPRAGSTMMQRILGGHSEIDTVSEPWIMLHPLFAMKQRQITTPFEAQLAEMALQDFVGHFPENIELFFNAVRNYAMTFYGRSLELSKKSFFLDKTPRYYMIIPELIKCFPNAKFIILLRNPMAVLSSTLLSWFKNNPDRLIQTNNYKDLVDAPKMLLDGINLLGSKGYTVHYEKLVQNTETEMQRLCSWLNIEFEPGMIMYGKNKFTSGRLGDKIGVLRYNHPVTDSIQKWKSNFKSDRLKNFARKLLQSIGYDVFTQMGYDVSEIIDVVGVDDSKINAINDDPELKKIGMALENGIEQLEANPDHIPTLLQMGELMIRLKRWDAAVIQYRHALDAGPKDEVETSAVRSAILNALTELKRAGQTTQVRDLSLAFLAFFPRNKEILDIWSSLVDTEDAKSIAEIHHAAPSEYRVSAIVSTYKSQDFIADCLENLQSQSIAGQIEIVIVDAASPEKERDIVQAYREHYDNITYIRTNARIGVYAAWNIAIGHAAGRYCMSVSTNDHLRRDACELLARELDDHPKTVLVFGDTYLTSNPHETFENNSYYSTYRWDDYSFANHLKDKCCVGPHPMWRRSIHETVGLFDERFVADGDQEFWMRLGSQFDVRHIAEFTGLQWITETSLSGKGSTPFLELEYIQALYRYQQKGEGGNRLKNIHDMAGAIPKCHINDGQSKKDKSILISTIVSTFNAEQFIRGCLDDLLAQSIADRMEIIVVDSGSQQNEQAVVREFQSRGCPVRYLRTEQREPVYAAWNRGIKIAEGKYVTSANTDDRHRRDAIEQMVGVMEARPEIDLVYADVIKTRTPNQTFETCNPTGVLCWPDWDRQRLIDEGCFIGPQPVWRKAVHDTYGYFDERFTISGDYEFWLRISQTSRFYHIPTPLGLYLEHDNSIEHRDPEEKRRQDMAIVNKYHPQMKSTQGGIVMLAPESILAEICRLADDDHTDMASWALDKLLEDYPNHAAIHNNRAVLAYKKGDEDAALNHYKRAAELAPDNARFQKDLGDFYVIQQQPEKALGQFERVLSLKADDVETLMAAGHLSVSLQRFDDARRYYQRVLAVDPGNGDARAICEKLDRSKTESIQMATSADLYAAAMEKADAGLNADAIKLLEQLLSMNPDQDQDQDHAVAHNDLGVLYYRQGNMDQAQRHYQQAAAMAPENAIFQKNLADFYWIEKGDVKAAMELYVRALTLDPRDVEALLCCGQICMQLQRIEDARIFFNSILENEPWNENARQLLQQLDGPAAASEISRKTGAVERPADDLPVQDNTNRNAIDGLEQAVARDPRNAEAYNDLGVLYYQQGGKRKALECYEKAVQYAPNHPVFQKNLADFYLIEEGRIKDALKIYVKVLEANPGDVECMLATGLVCVKMNNFVEARSFYERALEIEPWNSDARQALTHLDRLASDNTQPTQVSNAAG